MNPLAGHRVFPLVLFVLALLCLACGATKVEVRDPPTYSKSALNLDVEEYDRMLEMTPAQALERYGETIEGYLCRDCEFTLTGSLSQFRVELLQRFDTTEIERGDIRIKEMTWRVDAFRNLTIWYRSHPFGHRPVHQMVWNRTWQFDPVRCCTDPDCNH